MFNFKMDIENILSFSDISLNDPINLEDTEFDEFPNQSLGAEYLSNVDYSLNSPLISDEIDEFSLFLKGRTYRKSWNIKIWQKRKIALQLVKFNLSKLIPTSEFHKWFGKKNLNGPNNNRVFRSFLEQSQRDSDATFPIVSSFVKAWLKKHIVNPKKSDCDPRILRWGAYFLDLHIATLLLNALGPEEREELTSLAGVKYLSPNHMEDLTYSSNNFGKLLVSHGFVFFIDENIIMDRNTLLMCKDTYVARFQTLFSMVNRVDDLFGDHDWEALLSVYRHGDRLLETSGNSAYEGIKMVEPISALCVSDLAHAFRPLIPDFPAFREHIHGSVNTLRMQGIRIDELYNSITRMTNPDLVLAVFGSFRHWGHPYIDYLDGLEAVHTQVNMQKVIDRDYANILGSDLAFIVLSTKFNETKRWYVDEKKMRPEHPLYSHVRTHTWPTPKQIQDFGHNWHRLPLLPCFDIPDVIDPSAIYSDKSHSMTLDGVINHVRLNPNTPIPSKKVLQTFINSPATNWRDFLREINDTGLGKKDLVIGLKAKEREVKRKGRFFTLMSWRLREYFVVTEYLIKTFFVPLFHGLTMADDLNTVIKKLMDNSNGQGNVDYDNICIANHIDYTKWNNHQRHEANEPVFTVMGKFLGYPNLISRTHEFFQKSLIYYNSRPDLMRVINGELENKTDARVLWNGQEGGLEGLRQKGWSVVNLLVIRRESIDHNTKVKILAQGDNQVICTQYKLQKVRDDEELEDALRGIVANNAKIMEGIEEGTQKLGLIINRDETLQSADFLIYGKVPIFRGNIKGIESKRWSRVTCVTNDQMPTLANTLSSITSNALTVAHFSTSPLNSIVHYNFLGNFGRNLISIHDPAIRGSIPKIFKGSAVLDTKEYKSAVLYLDPCLGGACGMSLTRFLIRSFPDPLSESLTFWKAIHNIGPLWVKDLATRAGNPRLGAPTIPAFKKLIEDPLSINIPGGTNPLTLIKEVIRQSLIDRSREIQNDIIRSAVEYLDSQEDRLIEFLRSVKPLFPRFLSEYMSGTYLGIVRNLVGLFQNSKTIRNIFSRRVDIKVKKVIIDSEVRTIRHLAEFGGRRLPRDIWNCSSSQADKLRLLSWGTKVYGATVPHPMELIHAWFKVRGFCNLCSAFEPESLYISTLVPSGLSEYKTRRGPYKAYLGSRTSESTSILQPWEKDTKVPLIKRASKLRSSIGWFVDRDSTLAETIIQNLSALTGEDWGNQIEGFKRTGSALHRFSCSRQSSAGYAAQSPAKLTWMCTTTDTLSTLNKVNHDFMHQTLLIYAQATVAELMDGDASEGFFHHHISCVECLREIEEITLETESLFEHKDVHLTLERWKPADTPWSERRTVHTVAEGNWARLPSQEQSYHIGRAEGFVFGDLTLGGNRHCEDSSLFPLTIQNKVIPRDYLDGILDGLVRASSIHCISRRSVSELKRPREALLGMALHLIDKVSDHPSMLTLWRSDNFESLFFESPHRIPASYPLSNHDLTVLGKTYLKMTYKNRYISKRRRSRYERNIWIFSDLNDTSLIGLYSLSGDIVHLLYSNKLTNHTKNRIRSFKDIVIAFKDPDRKFKTVIPNLRTARRTNQELRHACKEIIKTSAHSARTDPCWKEELCVGCTPFPVPYLGRETSFSNSIPVAPRIQNPLISGMREFQFATGSHYKVRSIIKSFGLSLCDALVAGDGSGGISSMLLRSNRGSRVIFNSLLTLENVDLRGTTPSPPSAIFSLGTPSNQCVNLRTAWQNPSDLSKEETWAYFKDVKRKEIMHIDMAIIDAEIEDEDKSIMVEHWLAEHIAEILEADGNLIYKTYLQRLLRSQNNFLDTVGSQFSEVYLTVTKISSSQTSEVYILCKGRMKDNVKVFFDRNWLENTVKAFPAFQPLSIEFDRALGLISLNMWKGVPSLFVPDKYLEMSSILESLGIETGVIALLSELLEKSRSNQRKSVIFASILICLNGLINITSLYMQEPRPLSDNRVYNVGVLLTGFLQWFSLNQRDLQAHENAQNIIRHYFPLSWKTKSFQKKKGKELKKKKKDPVQIDPMLDVGQIMSGTSPSKGEKTFYKRVFSFTGRYSHAKNFHLDSKMGKIGQVVRIFCRVFGFEPIVWDESRIDTVTKSFNDNLTTRIIFSRTDLEDFIWKPLSINPSNKSFPFLNSVVYENDVSTYTS